MQRRDLIRFSLATAATGTLIPATAFAGDAAHHPHHPNPLAGSVFYTKEAPGRWKGKEDSHLPQIQAEKKDGALLVRISTAHEMKGIEHYIVKHVLLDKDHGFIAEKLFDPTQKDAAAVSEFSLDGYSGRVYALSVCNKHDTWMNSAEI